MSQNQFPHLSCVWDNPIDWDALNPNIHVPDEPGFYAFTDHPGALQPCPPGKSVLYVGIATQSLRARIKKYKSGDINGVASLHRGGLMTLLSRAVAHSDGKSVTHTFETKPIDVYIKGTAGKPAHHSQLMPNKIYLRWAVDYRAAIEALLIKQLSPRFNTMHSQT